jgi:hypothetical protein
MNGKLTLLVFAALLTVGFVIGLVADDLSMDATAEDDLTLGYSAGVDAVLYLGMVGIDTVDLTYQAGTYDASAPGVQATLGGVSSDSAAGGWLHYTLYGMGANHKITVECDTPSYVDSLTVEIETFTAGGSALGTLGTEAGSPVRITPTPTDLITAISYTDTWTGTGAAEGARVIYVLDEDPGISAATVTYTIVAE